MGRWSLYLRSAVIRVLSWASLHHRCFTLAQWLLGRIGSMALALCLLKIQDRWCRISLQQMAWSGWVHLRCLVANLDSHRCLPGFTRLTSPHHSTCPPQLVSWVTCSIHPHPSNHQGLQTSWWIIHLSFNKCTLGILQFFRQECLLVTPSQQIWLIRPWEWCIPQGSTLLHLLLDIKFHN